MRSVLFGLAIAAIATLAPGWALAGEAENEAIAHRVASNLKNSGQMEGYKVGIACVNGTVWLTGRVSNDQQLQTALAISEQTEGVQRVVSRLLVEGAPAQVASQSTLSSKLKSTLGRAFNNRSRTQLKSAMVRQAAAIEPTEEPIASQAPARFVQQRVAAPSRTSSRSRRSNTPVAYSRAARSYGGQPIPAHVPGMGRAAPARYDHPNMPGYAWPSYAAHPNYAGVTYPKQYSPTAWPYIGPFYPYPQVPLGWRKVTLEWDDGWWMLDFKD